MKKVAILLMFITILSKVLGLLRDIALSYFYGASSISDAFIIATTITTVIYSFLIKAISTTYIPMYKKIENEDGVSGSLKFTNNLLNIIMVLSLIMIVLGYIFTPQLVLIFAYGFSQEEFQLAVTFTRISLFGIVFTSLVFLFTGYLNVKKSFVIPTLIGFPLNILTIISIYLSHEYKLEILIIGSTMAIGSQLLVLIPFAIKNGYKYSFTFQLNDPKIKQLLWIAIPVMIGVSINQLNVLVDRTIASQIVTGGISALNYANKINLLVQGIFVVTISTLIYPTVSKLAAEKDIKSLKVITKDAINIIIALVIPASIGAMCFSGPIIEVLFLRGEFDYNAYMLTSGALFFYSIGMIGFGLREVLARVFYSMQNSRTPMINAVIGLILNIILNIIFSHYWGISGLALATSVSAILTTILLYYSLVKEFDGLYVRVVIINLLKVILASAFMAFVGKIIYNYLIVYLDVVALSLCIALMSCLLVYTVCVKFFKIEGFSMILDKVIK